MSERRAQNFTEAMVEALQVWRNANGDVDVEAHEVLVFADGLARVAEEWIDEWLKATLDSDEVRARAQAAVDPANTYAAADDVLDAIRDALIR